MADPSSSLRLPTSSQINVSANQQQAFMSQQPINTMNPTTTTAPATSLNHLAMGGVASGMRQPMQGGSGSENAHHDPLGPKFPPQNFDVPDINFSNSVLPNADFDMSLFTTAQQMFNQSDALFALPGHMMDMQPVNTGVEGSMSTGGPPSAQHQGHQGVGGAFHAATNQSPPGTSSSDDSDDVPLAQLAKRASSTPSPTPPTSTAIVIDSTTETASQDSSPGGTSGVSTAGPQAKKAKPSKRKKKKDPNEPQKPVSAYALFFRDTQATIKGHNPSASFGEVSKIVASMWDQLDPEHKEVYKKKTEMAKKQYLKQLAAYRASQVSKSAVEESEKSNSPPGVAASPSGPVTTALHSMPVGPGPVMSSGHLPVTMSGQMMAPPPQTMQMSPQQQQHMMQQQQMQHMQQQQPYHHQQQQMMMHQQQQQQHQMGIVQQPSPPLHHHQQHSPPQQQQQPSQQQPPQMYGGGYGQAPQPSMDNMMGYTDPSLDMDMAYPRCLRGGCTNQALENPSWDSEYCSNDCVITHCRDIFTSWVAARSGSSSSFPVK